MATRSSSRVGTTVADVTIAVDGSLSVERAHELAVESAIEAAFGVAEATMHVEPS